MTMKKLTALFSACTILFATLTGCIPSGQTSEAEASPVAVAILVGSHANAAPLNYTSTDVSDAVARAVKSYGYLSVISIDGKPGIAMEGSCDIDGRFKEADAQKLNMDAANRTAAILAALPEVRADDPEVDTLEALRLAIRSLASAPDGAEKVLLVLDSGLSTTGQCDFHNNLLSADPDRVAELLAEQEAIPDFSGVQIFWQHMGDVAPPQDALSPRQVNRLKALWAAIIERGGGKVEFCDAPPAAEAESESLPTVSTIHLLQELPVAFAPETQLSLEEPVFLYEDTVRFVADSDEFSDPESTRSVLTPIAELVKAQPDLRLLLIGTTAGDSTSEYALDLSLSRAEAVKRELISLGAAEDRLIAAGMGSDDPWHIPGLGLGELAAANRKVVLLNAESEAAQALFGLPALRVGE